MVINIQQTIQKIKTNLYLCIFLDFKNKREVVQCKTIISNSYCCIQSIYMLNLFLNSLSKTLRLYLKSPIRSENNPTSLDHTFFFFYKRKQSFRYSPLILSSGPTQCNRNYSSIGDRIWSANCTITFSTIKPAEKYVDQYAFTNIQQEFFIYLVLLGNEAFYSRTYRYIFLTINLRKHILSNTFSKFFLKLRNVTISVFNVSLITPGYHSINICINNANGNKTDMLIKTEDDILLAGITGGREKKKKKTK